MTKRGYFFGGVFTTIYLGTMLDMFHTLYITPEGVAPTYSVWQILGLLIGLAGIAFIVYLWDTSPK